MRVRAGVSAFCTGLGRQSPGSPWRSSFVSLPRNSLKQPPGSLGAISRCRLNSPPWRGATSWAGSDRGSPFAPAQQQRVGFSPVPDPLPSPQPPSLCRDAAEPGVRLRRVPRPARLPALPHHLPGPPPLQHLQVRATACTTPLGPREAAGPVPARGLRKEGPQPRSVGKGLPGLTRRRGSGMRGSGWMLPRPAQPRPCVAGPSTGSPTGRRTGSCPSPRPRAVPAGAEPTATRSAATEVRGCCASPVPALAVPQPRGPAGCGPWTRPWQPALSFTGSLSVGRILPVGKHLNFWHRNQMRFDFGLIPSLSLLPHRPFSFGIAY